MTPSVDIIGILVWIVVATGGVLISLVAWVAMRLHRIVDNLPDEITKKVQKVHDEVLLQVKEVRTTQQDLERDIRGQLTLLDRRVTTAEAVCNLLQTHFAGGKK